MSCDIRSKAVRFCSQNWKSGVIAVIAVIAVLLFQTVAGCDSAPGTVDLSLSPPRVFDLSLSPDSLDLATLDPASIIGDSVYVDVTIAVSASDVDSDLASVEYILLRPTRDETPIALGSMQPVSSGRYETTRRVALPVGETGNYTLTVFASDASGLLSNQVRGTLELAASPGFGSAPVVESVVATPNPLVPPSDLRVLATVSDEQGLSNILRVEVEIQDVVYLMSDDGESLGDSEAGDGVYTASFSVPTGVPAGVESLSVQAFDRNGNASDVVTINLTIQ